MSGLGGSYIYCTKSDYRRSVLVCEKLSCKWLKKLGDGKNECRFIGEEEHRALKGEKIRDVKTGGEE